VSYLEMAKQAAAQLRAAGNVPPAPPPADETSKRREESPKRPYAFPWPDEIEGLGRRYVGPFAACDNCGVGSWVRFGSWVLCVRCANLGRTQV